MQEPRRRQIRARQRDRAASLLGFERRLEPLEHEWAIDRLAIHVGGRWHSQTTGINLFDGALSDQDTDWFRAPQRKGTSIELLSRSPARSTLGNLEIVATDVAGADRLNRIKIECNPSRTLAHLLARYPVPPIFSELIASLSVPDFFAVAPEGAVAASLDANDNWLPNPAAARRVLGPSVFTAFMPIFVAKVQGLILRLLSQSVEGVFIDGTDHVVSSDGGRVTVRWARVRVPQVETYFERYHSDAVTAVRTAGSSILTGDHRNTLRRYSTNVDFERDADSFRIMFQVGDRRKLVIYAKSAQRIRFEVRRDKKADYDPFPPARAPSERILAKLEAERVKASNIVRWSEVGAQFDEADAPHLGDLIRLVGEVVSACGLPPEVVQEVLHALIVDGGLSPALRSGVPQHVISSLQGVGVVQRTRVRERDERNRPERYSLTMNYRDLRDALVRVLPQGHSPDDHPPDAD